ncbi:MAG: Fic family protein [Wenzhouxiangella sp.]
MKCGESSIPWQSSRWPHWRFDLAKLTFPLVELSRSQGLLLGRVAAFSHAQREQLAKAALAEEVLHSSALAGERLDAREVHGLIGTESGLGKPSARTLDRHAEVAVRLSMEARGAGEDALTLERIFGWHASLFPNGFSGLAKIRVGQWRDDAAEPMQLVLGRSASRQCQLAGPPAARLPAETECLIEWINQSSSDPPMLKAGLAHLWFRVLHPFEDGNARIARALADWCLSRAAERPRRYYSVSAQIGQERELYEQVFVSSCAQGLDASQWLIWFLENERRAVDSALNSLDRQLGKAAFWQRLAAKPLSKRQVQVLDQLVAGFDGKLTTSMWAAMADCSPDTALRDIKALVGLGVLRKTPAGGRSTAYELIDQPEP